MDDFLKLGTKSNAEPVVPPADVLGTVAVLVDSIDKALFPDDAAPTDGGNLIKHLAERMKTLDEAYVLIKRVYGRVNDEYDRIRKGPLPEAMLEADMRTATFDGIGRVQLGSDMYATIPADGRDAAYSWLRVNGYDSLITETVNASTLKAFLKEQIESGAAVIADKEMPLDKMAALVACSSESGDGQSLEDLGLVEGGVKQLPPNLFKVTPYMRASIVKAGGKKNT